MSWSISVPKTARDEFAAVVDASPLATQGTYDHPAIGLEDQQSRAKDLLKYLAGTITAPVLWGNMSGHAAQDAEQYGSISVSISGGES
jgi:hypothetical protein